MLANDFQLVRDDAITECSRGTLLCGATVAPSKGRFVVTAWKTTNSHSTIRGRQGNVLLEMRVTPP